MSITLKEIEEARARIKDVIQHTQLSRSLSASERFSREVYFKFENEQRTGSFKLRGALNKIKSLTPQELEKGVVASSAGNHAQGVALSAKLCNTRAHIIMPTNSPLIKVMATQSYGAEVLQHGEIYDESYAYARELEKSKGYVFVHPYEDDRVIAGQGTIGLEILEALPDVDSVIIPIGGGGMISGIASAIKQAKPSCRVYGAVAANTSGMYNLFNDLPQDENQRKPSIADGLAVKKPSEQMFKNYIKPLVDDIAAVSEEDIAEAIVFLLERTKSVVEGSGAVGLAALEKMNEKWNLGKKCCVILSGGNIDLNTIAKVIEKGLTKKGRLIRLAVVVPDRPGTLLKLTEVMARENANIIEVAHDRLKPHLNMNEAQIEFVIETKDWAHIEKIKTILEKSGSRQVTIY